MVAAPLILGGGLKISDQNNWGGPEQKIKFVGEINLTGGLYIVGKGVHTPPFLRLTPFLEIQDVSTFHRSLRKTKVLNNPCNQFV